MRTIVGAKKETLNTVLVVNGIIMAVTSVIGEKIPFTIFGLSILSSRSVVAILSDLTLAIATSFG